MTRWLVIEAAWDDAPDDWSARLELFRSFGIEGTEQQDDPPLLRAYTSPRIDDEKLSGLKNALEQSGAAVSRYEIEEKDWSEIWKEQFKPFPIGDRFWIRPSWDESGDPGDRHVIVIDPGQAFGTGDHPTTRMCMELLEAIPPADTLLDIGCGTGILSIAAAKLGWKSIQAVDIDEAAIECSEQNASRNDVQFEIALSMRVPEFGRAAYQLVVSNIISSTIIDLAPAVAPKVAKGGHWIVSGIIEGNWPEVRSTIEGLGLSLVDEKRELEWVAATFAR